MSAFSRTLCLHNVESSMAIKLGERRWFPRLRVSPKYVFTELQSQQCVSIGQSLNPLTAEFKKYKY